IYAPIANRLGLDSLYRELQELSFRHLYAMRYRVLAKAVRVARGSIRSPAPRATGVRSSGDNTRRGQNGDEHGVYGGVAHAELTCPG
ncbi:MAG: hypothetical protein NTV94_00855, partial [Planctomycetota bacterium]|nr:hypothetical protein [Planctomycetota bacterium]